MPLLIPLWLVRQLSFCLAPVRWLVRHNWVRAADVDWWLQRLHPLLLLPGILPEGDHYRTSPARRTFGQPAVIRLSSYKRLSERIEEPFLLEILALIRRNTARRTQIDACQNRPARFDTTPRRCARYAPSCLRFSHPAR